MNESVKIPVNARVRGDEGRRLLQGESGLGDRGVVPHPEQRPLVESGQELRNGHAGAPGERRPPQHPALPQQHEQADADAADAVEEDGQEAAADRDALVGGAHLLEAAVERLRHLEHVCQLGQAVAAHDETEPETPFAGLPVAPLVDERVIDPAAGAFLQGRFHRLVAVERDVPGDAGSGFRDGAGRGGVERGAGCVLGQPLAEAVRRAVGPEADLDLAHLAAAEVPDEPLVGMEGAVTQEALEGGGAAPLELDEAADAVVDAEAGRLAVVPRAPAVLVRQPARLGQGARAVHLEVELDHRERPREVQHRERRAGGGGGGERRPEDRLAEHGMRLLPLSAHGRGFLHSLRRNLSSSSTSSGSVPLCSRMPRTIFRGMPIPMCSRYP